MEIKGLTDRLAANLIERTGSLPSVMITSSFNLGNNISRITCIHSTNGGKKNNYKALAAALGPALTAIEGSFARVNDKTETRVVSVGYVSANAIVEPLTPEREKQMKVMAKNVLMDEGDSSLWNVQESASGDKYISRQETENVEGLLSTIASPRVGVVEASSIGLCYPNVGDYVAFVNPETETTGKGYVVSASADAVQILPRGSDDLVEIAHPFVYSAVAGLDTEDKFLERLFARNNVVEAAAIDADKLKEYYRRVYSYDPEFLALIEKDIDSHASL